ncbi:MAG: sarcosine oxidase subunit gamma [Proteobacteria bacterium]|nr:sarcosine oxidase subunit gamma [Pseudomonadota bacterium]
MANAYARRSALQHFGLTAAAAKGDVAGADLLIGEAAHRTIVNIRGDGGDAFKAAVRSVTGAELPVTPNTTAAAGDFRILWLGPTEWWVVSANVDSAKLADDLRQAFNGQHAAVIDVSESRTVINVSGPSARDVLARGCSLDLHPRVFGPGQCAQTGLTKANILLDQVSDNPSYDIYILKSFADYLWQWFWLVGRDFKFAIRAH